MFGLANIEFSKDLGERPTLVMSSALVIEDDCLDLLLSTRTEAVACIAVRAPRSLRKGVYVYVEGRTKKFASHEGKNYRLFCQVQRVRRSTKGNKKRVKVVLRGGLLIPPDFRFQPGEWVA